MKLKIVTAKSEVETEDTGTYADGLVEHHRLDLSEDRSRRHRSSHDRDYGAGRKADAIPFGLV